MPVPALSPHEAQQRITKLMSGATSSQQQDEIVGILSAMPDADRGEALRLLRGQGHDDVDKMLSSLDSTRRTQAERLIHSAAPHSQSAGTFIVSDGDDTMWPKADHAADTRYRGARALYRALDAGLDGKDALGDVHLVTARDGVFVPVSHGVHRSGVDVASVRHGNTIASIFGGVGVAEFQVREKVNDIERFLADNPSRNVILMGDTVQFDPEVFRRILKNHPTRVAAVLLHEVNGKACPADLQSNPLVVPFTDYADLGRKLFARGTINAQQLDDVVHDR